MMRRVAVVVALAGFAFAAVSGFGLLYGGSRDSRRTEPETILSPERVALLPEGPSSLGGIRVFEERVRQNPEDVVSLTFLGQLHAERARETGDIASYLRAERVLRRAVRLLPGYAPAGAALAAVYHAEHRFADALALARQVSRTNRGMTQALGTTGDALLALGRYRRADDAYDMLALQGETSGLLARQSHLAWLRGNTPQAIELMERAASHEVRSGRAGESVAWYLVRLGDLEFGSGLYEPAREHYEAALAAFDGMALARMGRVEAARRRYEAASALYEQAAAMVPNPEYLAALGDLYALTGHPARAEREYETVELIGRLTSVNGSLYNRQLALFYADHDRNVNVALELARRELEVRRDVFEYDTLAWALYKNDRYRTAARAIEAAMALGTRDAALLYHAGMIQAALGHDDRARALLSEALAINPRFDPLQSSIARATLDELDACEGASGG